MKIYIESKRRKIENVRKQYPGAVIIDVTSNGTDKFAKFSPFYSSGKIPVPGMPGTTALCVEGIWQGLKIFENEGIDKSIFQKTDKNIKRTVRKYGKVLGHHYGDELLGYFEARKKIYIPSYKYVLDYYLNDLILELSDRTKLKPLVLLDYATNTSILMNKPLSHAALIKAALINDFSILEKSDTSSDNPTQISLF